MGIEKFDSQLLSVFDRVIEAEKPSPGMTNGVAFLVGGRKHIFSLPTFYSVDERDDASKDGVPDLLVKYMDDSKYLRAHLGATSTDTELRLGERQILELLSYVGQESYTEPGKSSKEYSVYEILSRAKQKNALNTLRTMIYTAKGERLSSCFPVEYVPSRPLVSVSIAAPGEPTQGIYRILQTQICKNLECDAGYLLNNNGKTQACGKCKLAHYCSTKCQTADWQSHKKVCGTGRVETILLPMGSVENGIDLTGLSKSTTKSIGKKAKDAFSTDETIEEDLEVNAGNSGGSNSTNDNKETTTAGGHECDKCRLKESDTLKLKLCSICKKVRYCSQKCQKQAWETHKPLCKSKDPNALRSFP